MDLFKINETDPTAVEELFFTQIFLLVHKLLFLKHLLLNFQSTTTQVGRIYETKYLPEKMF